ncbi:MAG: sodium:proton antiporter [Deltaproteobacteria bacterium RIFOXYA12_FULL_61_11]|nr:MAG: sodium:proton antiporter [Deltaproteobacteria bacterium RIFOXYA12_FULL_61_11]
MAETPPHGAGHDLGRELPLWSILPFVGILLSIALFPLLAPHFWHHHFPKVSLFWALLFAGPFLLVYGGTAVHSILHIYLLDYIPFIILLWSLYTVSGGILIEGSLRGTPQLNALLILIGTLIASWVGTTGASMLLIRPLLRANAGRKNKVHTVIFFIFLVSNIGGSLTPLGDPPLFLGFLHSVPFFWTMHLLGPLALTAGLVLAIYFILDLFLYRREGALPVDATGAALRIRGLHNLLFLGGIIGAVLLSGFCKFGTFELLGTPLEGQNLLRDGLMILMGILSLRTTARVLRQGNEFTWDPILEVAYLFAGIFMTIIPALAILKAGEHGSLAILIRSIETPAHYFWITGALSSFLDNAPTYLTFFNTALGTFAPGMSEPLGVAKLIAEQETYLVAISIGAVFMGANTYIGNAPNFMVKSIAEATGVQMPSFFGYMFKFSLPILIPVFALITLILF